MSQNESLKEVLDYIQKSRFATLNYVRTDKAPVSRAMGSYAFDGTSIIFSTQPNAAKVKAINDNKRISFFFEQDNQELSSWKSVLAIGNAELVVDVKEKNRFADILAKRSPRFKERLEKGELDEISLFILKTEEFQFLDRSKGSAANQTILL